MSPVELLDISIAQLQTLRAFLSDQLREIGEESAQSATAEVRACNEILLSLSSLIPDVQTARNAISDGENCGGRALVGLWPLLPP